MASRNYRVQAMRSARERADKILLECAKTRKARNRIRSGEVLVAEGDSWFDYPGPDILDLLEDEHGYEVEDVAHKGDRVEDMAYSSGQLAKFIRKIEKIVDRGSKPKAILLSGGGNDISGDELKQMLNHSQSSAPGLNPMSLDAVIDFRLQDSYTYILQSVTTVCQKRIGHKVPILVHGYDYAVPDGRGFWGGWGPLPGPWLRPALLAKGYTDKVEQQRIIDELIDRFNKMISGLVKMPGLKHVRYVNLLGLLPRTKLGWANELHPSKAGFKLVTQEFANSL